MNATVNQSMVIYMQSSIDDLTRQLEIARQAEANSASFCSQVVTGIQSRLNAESMSSWQSQIDALKLKLNAS